MYRKAFKIAIRQKLEGTKTFEEKKDDTWMRPRAIRLAIWKLLEVASIWSIIKFIKLIIIRKDDATYEEGKQIAKMK